MAPQVLATLRDPAHSPKGGHCGHKKSSAPSARTHYPRRAHSLYRTRGADIEELSPETYRVPGQDGEHTYRVHYGDSEANEYCSGPDHEHRGVNCVHILAVGIHHAKRRPKSCPACYRGVLFLTDEEDGHEWTELTPAGGAARS